MAVDQRRVRIGQQLTSFRPSRISPGDPSNADWMRLAPPSAVACYSIFASAADLKFLQRVQKCGLGTPNRKAALVSFTARAPLLPKFVRESAAVFHELRKRGTGRRTEKAREADLSTEQAGTQTASRLSRPHGDQGRPQGHQRAPGARSQASVCLTFMTPRLQRLRRRADFIATASGAKAHATGFVLQSRERRDQAPPRVGFTVSKKVGDAVERNRVRRRLREVVRLAGTERMRAGRDYVLVGRRAALDLAFDRLIDDMSVTLGRVHRGSRHEHRSPVGRETK
jgi:ribonuclease P protein component